MNKYYNETIGNNINTDAFFQHAVNYKSIVFSLEKFSLSKATPGFIVANIHSNTEMFSYLQDMTGELVIELVHQVYTKDAEKVIMIPCTWWDMFKDSHFPEFLKKKFPPAFKEHRVKQKVFLVDGNTVDYPAKSLYFYGLDPLRNL